jgi:hypothetical protein
MEMPLSPYDCQRRFKELCDRLKQSDSTLLKIDNIHVLPKSGYGRRLGAAIQRNAVVTQLHLRLNGLLCPKDVATSQTHGAMLLLQFIKASPSLRKVLVTTSGCDMDQSLTRLILEAMTQNPSISALNLDMWDLPVNILIHFLDTRPRLVSLDLNGTVCYEDAPDAQAAGRALAALESLKTLKFTIQEHMDLALLPMVGHVALRRLQIHCSGGHYGTKSEFASLVAMLGHCANLQHLALSHFSSVGAPGILLGQGLHDCASSRTMLPLKSLTLEQCLLDAEASAAWFTGNESIGMGGQEMHSTAVFRVVHALKLLNCTFGNGYTFPNITGFLTTTNLTRFVLYENAHHSWFSDPQWWYSLQLAPNSCSSLLLAALRQNGCLCRLTIRSGRQIPFWNVQHQVRAILTRNKQIPRILTNMGAKNGDACCSHELVPTLFAVAFQARHMAPNSLLTGLLAICESGPHVRNDTKRLLVPSVCFW